MKPKLHKKIAISQVLQRRRIVRVCVCVCLWVYVSAAFCLNATYITRNKVYET